MFKFKHGESYLWLFPVYAVAFVSALVLSTSITGRMDCGILIMPAFLGFILLCELTSGVALDSWFRAKHLKGTNRYKTMVAWHGFATLALLVISYFSIR